jgi:hypothetical protein
MKITLKELRDLITEAIDLPPPSDYRVIPIGDALKEFPEAMKAWLDEYGGTLDDRVLFSDGALWVDRIEDGTSWRWVPMGKNWVFDG